MKKLISRIHQLPAAVSALLAVLAAAVLALVIEIGVFQFSFFSQNFGDYPETSLDLSAIGEWNGEALVLLPESPTVSFDDLDLPVRSVTVSTLGSSEVLSGTISVCDEASQYQNRRRRELPGESRRNTEYLHRKAEQPRQSLPVCVSPSRPKIRKG